MTFVAAALLNPLPASGQSAAAIAELQTALREARDADLRADWEALLDARARVAGWKGGGDAPSLAAYYLGYIEWRLSSLAYLVTGAAGMQPPLDRAVSHLRSAVAAQPSFGEAQALLATCAGMLVNSDRSRLQELMPVTKSAWAAALEHGADNPRVQLLRAMNEVFVPPQYGGDAARGFDRWKEALALFEQEEKRGAAGSTHPWGRAEAWAWLGGAYLMSGRHADAQAALEHAVRLRPDFWWAAKAALPQARRPAAR
jgi:tetratricopeptide (TPR) repeat protein